MLNNCFSKPVERTTYSTSNPRYCSLAEGGEFVWLLCWSIFFWTNGWKTDCSCHSGECPTDCVQNLNVQASPFLNCQTSRVGCLRRMRQVPGFLHKSCYYSGLKSLGIVKSFSHTDLKDHELITTVSQKKKVVSIQKNPQKRKCLKNIAWCETFLLEWSNSKQEEKHARKKLTQLYVFFFFLQWWEKQHIPFFFFFFTHHFFCGFLLDTVQVSSKENSA